MTNRRNKVCLPVTTLKSGLSRYMLRKKNGKVCSKLVTKFTKIGTDVIS